ncbi:MAG: hypothetical protein DRP64_14615 [Verrucomicrobia bacterium]|nr:MAG: hypothetical protein DRP64_14615 [Verrucomicrobiota bacterium]
MAIAGVSGAVFDSGGGISGLGFVREGGVWAIVGLSGADGGVWAIAWSNRAAVDRRESTGSGFRLYFIGKNNPVIVDLCSLVAST